MFWIWYMYVYMYKLYKDNTYIYIYQSIYCKKKKSICFPNIKRLSNDILHVSQECLPIARPWWRNTDNGTVPQMARYRCHRLTGVGYVCFCRYFVCVRSLFHDFSFQLLCSCSDCFDFFFVQLCSCFWSGFAQEFLWHGKKCERWTGSKHPLAWHPDGKCSKSGFWWRSLSHAFLESVWIRTCTNTKKKKPSETK